MITTRRLLVVCAAILAVGAFTAWFRPITETHLQAVVAERYPVDAAAVVEARGYPGPLYNHFNWGGFLIWRLPQLPVSMDGRTNVYGTERIARALQTWSGRRGWDTDPDLLAARLVIASAAGALAELLRLDARFVLVYEDTTAAVFQARSRPSRMDLDNW